MSGATPEPGCNTCYMIVERTIDAPSERVWSLLADLDHWDEILPTMQDVSRAKGSGPRGVGASYAVRAQGLPRTVYEVTEWNPGKGFTWVASSPGVRTTATHAVRAQGDQTHLALGIEWTGALAFVARLLLEKKSRRMVELEADTFARLAEADRPT